MKFGTTTVFALVALMVAGLLLVGGCAQKFTQEEVDSAVAAASVPLQAQVDSLVGVNADLSADLAVKDTEIETLKATLTEATQAIADLQVKVDELSAAPTPEEKPVVVQVQSETIDDLYLGSGVSFMVDDGDLDSLFDGEIEFNDEKYDVKEEFRAIAGKSYIGYSAVDDEEFGANPYYVLTDKGALEYSYVFKDAILMSDITDDVPLNIKFLGVDTEIVAVDASKVLFRSGDKFTLREGQTMKYDGKEVTLLFVSENGKVAVSVDGVAANLNEYETKVISGLDVRVEDILINSRDGLVTLVLGDDVIYSQTSNDNYYDNEEFEFRVVSDGGYLKAFIVSYDERRNDLEDDYTPLALGDVLSFPNEFINVEFSKILNTDYVTFEVSFDEFDETLDNGIEIVDKPAVVIESSSKNVIEILDEETSLVYVGFDGKVYYQDANRKWFEADLTDVKLVNDDAEVTLSLDASNYLVFNISGESITIATDFVNEQLGLLEGEAESSDIVYSGKLIGSKKYDYLTSYGIVVPKPKSSAESDEFVFKLPSDRVEVELRVY